MAKNLTSIHGRQLGLTAVGNLAANDIDITQPAADATITIGTESANVRALTIQLLDVKGNAREASDVVEVFVFADAGGLALATTGGSTGIAIGTDGAILNTVLAKKIFTCATEADGDLDLTWTDTGTEEVFLGILLPTGRMVFSASIQNAA